MDPARNMAAVFDIYFDITRHSPVETLHHSKNTFQWIYACTHPVICNTSYSHNPPCDKGSFPDCITPLSQFLQLLAKVLHPSHWRETTYQTFLDKCRTTNPPEMLVEGIWRIGPRTRLPDMTTSICNTLRLSRQTGAAFQPISVTIIITRIKSSWQVNNS